MVFTQGLGFVLGALFDLPRLTLRFYALVCHAVDKPLWQRGFFLVNSSVLQRFLTSERSGVAKPFVGRLCVFMIERFNQIQAMLVEPFNFGSEPLPDSKPKLPEAYSYFASSPHAADLLHKYSNTDKFWFEPHDEDIIATPAGKILLFNRESQGNFELGILLDSADPDPPV